MFLCKYQQKKNFYQCDKDGEANQMKNCYQCDKDGEANQLKNF